MVITLRQRLLLGSVMIASLGSGYGRRAYAGGCTAIPVSTCSGAANVFDVQQTLNAGAGTVSVTTNALFGITTSGSDNAVELRGDSGVTFTDINSSTITGGNSAIYAHNGAGSGGIDITTIGQVTGLAQDGIRAYGRGGDLTITANRVTGAVDGIHANNNVNAGVDMTITTTGLVTGTAGTGIYAYGKGTNLTIDTAAVTGANYGIYTRNNFGVGVLSVTSHGTVSSGNGTGVYAVGFGTDTIIDTQAVDGGTTGIDGWNRGYGDLIITSNGIVTGGTAFGIKALNNYDSTNLSVTANANVTGNTTGIYARNQGSSGTLLVEANGEVTGTTDFGIRTNSYGGTDHTIIAKKVTGATDGIFASSRNSGFVSITATDTVTGTLQNGIRAENEGTYLRINATDVHGGYGGIRARNTGSEHLAITAANVTGSIYDGIYAFNRGTDLSVTAVNVTGGENGILARNYASGALTVTSTGSAYGNHPGRGNGIDTVNRGTNTVINAVRSYGGQNGINANNYGSGYITIAATDLIAGNTGFGIFTSSDNATTDMTVRTAAVTGAKNGIYAKNRGIGELEITSTGTVTGGTGQAGIYARNDGTDMSVNAVDVSGGAHGILATNYGSGAITVTSTGAATGTNYVGVQATNGPTGGPMQLNIHDATGGLAGIVANNYGLGQSTITLSGRATGTGLVGIYGKNGNASGFGTQINILGSAIAEGGLAGISGFSDAGQAIFINNDGIIQNLSANSTALAIKIDATTNPFITPVASNGRTIITNTNLVTGTVLLGGLADTFTNTTSATWNTAGGTNDFGGGVDNLVNRGLVLAANAAGTAETTTFSNLETFTNAASGRLRLRDGATGDRAVIGGDYVSAGGLLEIDTILNEGGTASDSDVLVINGNSFGNSLLRVNAIGGAGALTVGNGILVVDVAGSSSGTFSLANTVSAGAFNYKLNQVNSDWFLQTAVNSVVASTAVIPQLTEDVGLTFLGTLHERVGEQEHINQRSLNGTAASGMWSRVIGKTANETFETSSIGDLGSASTLAGLQAGFDFYRHKSDTGSTTYAGLYGGFAWANAGVDALATPGSHGRNNNDGWLAGLYATHYSSAGWYSDAVLQGSWLDMTASGSGGHISTATQEWLASVEVGMPLTIGDKGSALEPQVQLIYSSTNVGNTTDSAGLAYSFDTQDSFIGRAGFRLKGTHDYGDGDNGRGFVTGYLKANLWGNLNGGDSSMMAGATPIDVSGKSLWADAGMGLTVQAAKNTELFADGDVEFGIDQAYQALTAKAGVKLGW